MTGAPGAWRGQPIVILRSTIDLAQGNLSAAIVLETIGQNLTERGRGTYGAAEMATGAGLQIDVVIGAIAYLDRIGVLHVDWQSQGNRSADVLWNLELTA